MITVQRGVTVRRVFTSKAENGKDNPNVTRLRSLLSGIGSLTHYVGALRPAYENLRDAATWVGGFF